MPISHWGAAVWDRRRVRGLSQAASQNVVGPIDACNPNFASCPSRTTSGMIGGATVRTLESLHGASALGESSCPNRTGEPGSTTLEERTA
jgi:hypothetical protein